MIQISRAILWTDESTSNRQTHKRTHKHSHLNTHTHALISVVTWVKRVDLENSAMLRGRSCVVVVEGTHLSRETMVKHPC